MERIQEDKLIIIIDVYDNYSEDVFSALRVKDIIKKRDFEHNFLIDDVELTFKNTKIFNKAKKILKKFMQ